jgi:hypothetical protein
MVVGKVGDLSHRPLQFRRSLVLVKDAPNNSNIFLEAGRELYKVFSPNETYSNDDLSLHRPAAPSTMLSGLEGKLLGSSSLHYFPYKPLSSSPHFDLHFFLSISPWAYHLPQLACFTKRPL